MTCEHALDAMLDADLPEAIGGATSLAGHVNGCARCRHVANQLMTDTRLLASAVARGACAAARDPPDRGVRTGSRCGGAPRHGHDASTIAGSRRSGCGDVTCAGC